MRRLDTELRNRRPVCIGAVLHRSAVRAGYRHAATRLLLVHERARGVRIRSRVCLPARRAGRFGVRCCGVPPGTGRFANRVYWRVTGSSDSRTIVGLPHVANRSPPRWRCRRRSPRRLSRPPRRLPLRRGRRHPGTAKPRRWNRHRADYTSTWRPRRRCISASRHRRTRRSSPASGIAKRRRRTRLRSHPCSRSGTRVSIADRTREHRS